MKNILFGLLALSFVFSAVQAKAEEDINLELNVCIAQFPCHLKTGRLLPGFKAGTACKWENICEDYRESNEFRKLQQKLRKQKKASKRKPINIKARI